MTDHDPDHDADLSPEQDEVRRLLADARHDGPMPADVVARLDRVLADLAEEPGLSTGSGPVTSLATRRRRVTQLLVAAAAVVVVGVGVGQVLDGTGTGSDSSPMAENDSAADAGAAEDAPGDDAEPAPSEAEPQQEDSNLTADRDGKRVWRLRSKDFAADAAELSSNYAVPGLSPQRGLLDRRTAAAASCRAEEWGAGSFVPVTYDGAPGVLVFRRARGDTQVADLFLCGSTEPLRSITLPAP